MGKIEKGIVIWLTGLPCSGKTTLSREIEKYFRMKKLPIQCLDGDVVRRTISRDLGFSKEDRDRNIERMSHIAQMLSDNGVHVVSAFVSPYQRSRTLTRSLCERYVEVYVKCSIQTCKERDVKGMYARAQRGEIVDFTGVQDPFEIPDQPDVIVDTECNSVQECIDKIIGYLKEIHDL